MIITLFSINNHTLTLDGIPPKIKKKRNSARKLSYFFCNKSLRREMHHCGVLQGSVLDPIFFNVYH